ncbi:MAG TPA: phosphatase PAP2 family protein [Solirubrobacteraceae bacterium]|jgi:hypothetical protein
MLVARRIIDPRTEASSRPDRKPVMLRAYVVAPVIAAAMLVFTLVTGGHYGIALRDPDGVVGSRMFLLAGIIALFWALDVVPRAARQSRSTGRPFVETVIATARARWTLRRMGVVLGSIVAFYVTYLCYRNVKSYLPLARPELLDTQMLALERDVFGDDPATILHEILGTGIAAHVLSTVYLLFLTFVPISLGFALVWSTDTATGLWWVSALSLNWVFGAISYFLVPTMGPAFAAPELFNTLPDTGASALQQTLLEHRQTFLHSPIGSGELQSIAAFASLHVAIVFTGALMVQILGAPRPLRYGMWTFFCLTVLATIYFGWHYVLDDVAGLAIGFAAVYLGARLTGWRIERTRQVTAIAT